MKKNKKSKKPESGAGSRVENFKLKILYKYQKEKKYCIMNAMAKKKSGKKNDSREKWHNNLKEETKHSILAVFFLVAALFFTLASFGKAGVVGSSVYDFLEMLFGAGFFLVPTALFLAAISLISSFRPNFLSNVMIGMTVFLVSGLGAADVMFGEKTGGYIGYAISWPLVKLFDFWVSLVILTALFIVSFLIIFNTSIKIKIQKKTALEKISEAEKTTDKNGEISSSSGEEKKEGGSKSVGEKVIAGAKEVMDEIREVTRGKSKTSPKKEKEEETEIEIEKIKNVANFVRPPIELLSGDKGKPSSGDIKASANIIRRTLQNFGIEVEMGEINVGPSVTQFTLKPAEGVKLSRILALQNDLSMALAAHPIRIEAPIPGRSLVGIEIPNSAKTIVGLSALFATEEFRKPLPSLLLSLGRDVSGKPVFANLSKMPHLLIAGATGAGKSICIHTVITSLLYRNSPETLRFIMIDPKRVELSIYDKVPHMMTPVITEPKKAILALKWACKEMEKRYELLLKAGVRDIDSYHKKSESEENPMPYLVIIIDELADIMATYPREMEASIVRLAQMSRAVGIHLIVSTQRPSVEVITGLIKANITSRIALQVASQIDSRTILDMSGAEKLLGKGDMLFLAGDTAKPKRIQGPFISEKEIQRVAKYLSEEYKGVDIESGEEESEDDSIGDILRKGNDPSATKAVGQSPLKLNLDEMEDDGDELYEDAREIVIKTGKASSSYLQRRLKIGYSRAARLLDILEERGVVGPSRGAKARDVYIKEDNDEHYEDYEENKVDF